MRVKTFSRAQMIRKLGSVYESYLFPWLGLVLVVATFSY